MCAHTCIISLTYTHTAVYLLKKQRSLKLECWTTWWRVLKGFLKKMFSD